MSGKPLFVSILFGVISFLTLQMISNLEFVKESDRTFEGADSLLWILLIAVGLALACYRVMLYIEDYLSHCNSKPEGKAFIRKTIVRYFLPLILIFIAAFAVCGICGVNIFGELLLLGTICFVITFPKFLNRHRSGE